MSESEKRNEESARERIRDSRRSRAPVGVIEKSSSGMPDDFWKGQTGFRYPLARRRAEAVRLMCYTGSRF